MDERKIKQAIILAGGEGRRLRPLTTNCPKPMVPVGGKPFVEYMVGELKKSGIEKIVFLLGYLPEKVTEYFGDGSHFGIQMTYSIGKVEDDTGTRIRNAEKLLDQDFLLMYGDVYWPFMDIQAMSEFYYASRKLGLIVVCDKGESKPNIWVDDENNVLRYVYGPNADDPKFNWTEVGIFIMNKKIVDSISERDNVNLNKTTLPDLVARNQLVAWKTDKVPDTITHLAHVSTFAEKMRLLR